MTCNPLIGQHVHYVSYGTPDGEHQSTCRAAIITAQYDATGDFNAIMVLNPTGTFFNNTPYSDTHEPGTWHWPPHHTNNPKETEN